MQVVFSHDIFAAQAVGGISRYFCELASGLLGLGVDVRVAAGLFTNRHLGEALGNPSLAGVVAGRAAGRLGRRRFLLRVLNEACFAVRGKVPRGAILHRTYYPLAEPIRGVRQVTTVHDMAWERFPGASCFDPVNSFLKRRAVARADLVLTVSAATRDDLCSIWGVPPEKVVVVHHGVAPPRPAASAKADEAPFLLFVGRRDAYKNFLALLQGLARARGVARDLRLICFGGGPFSRAERAAMHRLGLVGRIVQREGDDAALSAHYRDAVALVHPSIYEGFGLPLLEAMAHGCPVLCARTPALLEVAGRAAYYFDPRDPEAIGAIIEEVVDSPATLAELRQAGDARWRRFTWRACAERTLDAYRSLA